MKTIKCLILAALFAVSSAVSAAGGGTFVYVAPTAPPSSPSMPNITAVVDAVKSVSTAFNFTDATAIAALDAAVTPFALSIKIQNVDTSGVVLPTYNSGTGTISWTPNLATLVSNGNVLVQTDTAGYDAAALAFRDVAGNFAVKAIIEGESGINRMLVSIDAVGRTVNGVTYTAPAGGLNGIISDFNAATNMTDKQFYIDKLYEKLGLIQAQAAAIETNGAAAITLMNTVVLPEAGRNSASFADLATMLAYHNLGPI